MRKKAKKISVEKGESASAPTICFFMEHTQREAYYAIYMIKPPVDMPKDGHLIDSEGFMAGANNIISPVATIKNHRKLCLNTALVNLGSKIYLLGGWLQHFNRFDYDYKKNLGPVVKFFDTDHPERGLQLTSPMNGVKNQPCVFAANGMIYALGSPLSDKDPLIGIGTGVFECYDPISNQWQVLPDPPIPPIEWGLANLLDSATVVGDRLFVGSDLCATFNLNTRKWDPLPPPKLGVRRPFPYGALYEKETDSLYHLSHSDPLTWKQGASTARYRGPVKVVKKGPLTALKDSRLLNDPCLDSGKEQVMIEGADLDENTCFTKRDYDSWRALFHMGGRVFCYVATAQLLATKSWLPLEGGDEYSRGVLIKFFEVVPAENNNSDINAKFRTLASFCYKITTKFPNLSDFTRCCVLGGVPDSWIKSPPLKKKQEITPEHNGNKESKELMKSYEHDRNKELQEYNKAANHDDAKRLLADREEELARKNELLKKYEALLVKAGVMVDVQ